MSALAGKHIVITRPSQPQEAWIQQLERWGARVSLIPLIEITPRAFQAPPAQDFDWLFFTSRNAVRHFYAAATAQEADYLQLPVAVVGPATAQALLGHRPNGATFVSPEATAEAAARAFCQTRACQGLRILWPQGNLADPAPARILAQAQAQVTPLVVYETAPRATLAPEEAQVWHSPPDCWVFASPSAVTGFHRLAATSQRAMPPGHVACIGPKTAQKAKELLGRVDIQPAQYNFSDLAEAIRAFYQG